MGAAGRARGSPASVHGGQREGHTLEEQEHEESLAGRAVAYALSILTGLGGWGGLRNPATRLGGTGWAPTYQAPSWWARPDKWTVRALHGSLRCGPHTYLPGGWARAQRCQFRAWHLSSELSRLTATVGWASGSPSKQHPGPRRCWSQVDPSGTHGLSAKGPSGLTTQTPKLHLGLEPGALLVPTRPPAEGLFQRPGTAGSASSPISPVRAAH